MKKLSTQLGYYLAGLIEGDGTIWTSKTLRSSNNRIYNPQIVISFNQKDKPLFTYLKSVLNTGGISKDKLSNAGNYRISDKDKLIEVINLINGKFRTPKIKALHKAIDRLNSIHNTNIEKLPLDTSNLNSNAWLAGFTDADGNFHISLMGIYELNNLITRGRVICSFSIRQRLIDKITEESCFPFMTKIADLFKCKVTYKVGNQINLAVQANNKHYLVKSYFDKYPLRSSKYLDYLCYLQGQNYLNKSLTNKEIVEVQFIKNSMNNKRIYFNWDHLENFN